MASQPTSRRAALLTTALAVVTAASAGVAPTWDLDGAPAKSIVVEAIAKGGAGEAAGLAPGDVLTAWERTARRDAEAAGARSGAEGESQRESLAERPDTRGELLSPFDLTDVEVEQAPRGVVTLRGRRGGQEIAFTLGAGDWRIETRPAMNAEDLAAYEQGKAALDGGDAADGGRLWRELAARVEGGDSRLACWLLMKLGDRRAQAKARAESDAAYAAAQAVAREARERGAVHVARARALEAQQDAAAAAEAWRAALETLASPAVLRPAAAGAAERAPAEGSASPPESLAAVAALQNLGRLAWLREDLEVAESFYGQALAGAEALAPSSRPVASALAGLASVLLVRGDAVAAGDPIARAVRIRERLVPESPELAANLNTAGLIASVRGDTLRAEDLLLRSLRIRERAAPPSGDLNVARSFHNLAGVAHDADTARDLLEKSLALSERFAPGGFEVAGNLNDLGTLAHERGDLDAADAYYRRAVEILEKVNPDGVNLGRSLANLADLQLERGRLDDAERLARRAVESRAGADTGDAAAAFLGTWGDVLEARGERAAAAAAYDRALAIARRMAPESQFVVNALSRVARLAARSGDPRAATLYRECIDVLDSQGARLSRSQESRITFGRRNAGVYQEAIAVLVDGGHAADAFHVLERSRARSFLALLGERDLVHAEVPAALDTRGRRLDAEYDRTQSRLVGLDALPQAAEIESLHARLRELRVERQRVREEIRRSSPRVAALRDPQPLDLAGVQQALDPGTVLLSYAVARDRTDLFVVGRTAGGAPVFAVLPIAAGREALQEKVRAFREGIRAVRPAAELATHAGALYDLLVRPAEGHLGAARRVLISPDGPLHTLPFAALRRAEGYLVEWKPLHTVISATVYAELRAAPPGRRRAGASLVAFGDPRYPSAAAAGAATAADPVLRDGMRRGLRLTPLPASRDEVAAIARMYPGRSRLYVGGEATEERAKGIGAAGYVHFACHGFLDERVPLNSSLALSIPAGAAEGRDNGLLQAWEVFERVRLDADLVTLSACDSGGKEMGGEGLIGLTRAFQYAGARSVVASLWSVPDRATAGLMRSFYGGLRRGLSKDEALRQAQIASIRGGPARLHPLAWAAFQLFGDWR